MFHKYLLNWRITICWQVCAWCTVEKASLSTSSWSLKQRHQDKGISSEEPLQISSCGKDRALRAQESSPLGLHRQLFKNHPYLCSFLPSLLSTTLYLQSPSCFFFLSLCLSLFFNLSNTTPLSSLLSSHKCSPPTCLYYVWRSQRHVLKVELRSSTFMHGIKRNSFLCPSAFSVTLRFCPSTILV